jgi:WD40 repeat protein
VSYAPGEGCGYYDTEETIVHEVGVTTQWHSNNGHKVQSFEWRSDKDTTYPITSVAVTPDGKYIISGSGFYYNDYCDGFGGIKIWEIASGKEVRTVNCSFVSSVAITPDGKYIVSSQEEFDGDLGFISVFEISSGKEVRSFVGQNDRVTSVAITPNGKYIVSGSNDGSIKLWEISSGNEVRSFVGHGGSIASVAITPNGKYIVSGSDDGSIKLWEIIGGKLIGSYVAFSDGEWLSWNPNGEYNCSDGAYEYFCFVDDSKGMPEVVPQNHPVYKAKKTEKLLKDYKGGTNPYIQNPPQTVIEEYRPTWENILPEIDINDEEIPF